MTDTALPTEERPIQMDPDLSSWLNDRLSKYEGEQRKAAQKAVMSVYHSGAMGDFSALKERYDAAIEEAVSDG